MPGNLFSELRPAWMITRREVRDQFRDWRIIFPIVILTIFFPFLMNFTAQQLVGFAQKYGASLIGLRLVPFLLMIVGFFPISVSLVIALESFVGEKERGSIEPLLATPLKDWQLYLGKLVAVIVPPLVGSYLGMGVYLISLVRGGIALPEPAFLWQVLALTSVQATVMVAGAVVVSTQATSVRAANLLASFIIIPVAFLIQGESVVLFWGQTGTLWWIVGGLLVLTGLLVRVGLAHFQREELLGRDIDMLNFHWLGSVFWKNFTGEAHSLGEWYWQVVPKAGRQLLVPGFIVAGLIVVGFLLGMREVSRFTIPLGTTDLSSIDSLDRVVRIWPLFSISPVISIWLQNIRVLAISLVLGVFSFGILGMIPSILTMGIAGYLMQVLAQNGMSQGSYLVGFILPHGILEIPAMILATAAVLRMGALLATPNHDQTIGEVWLAGLANWAKILIGWVIPMLLIAAMLEVWLTPRLALWLLH